MRFLSVCSGIEAASVAWGPLGWHAAAFSEIEPFPCSLLAHHYPSVPNLGDMTRFQEWPYLGPIDLLCGGTPCQSFSIAGLRAGLADPRGNLMLTFGAIAARYRPEWLVWENVPGVLSSNGGRDFGAFLGLLGELGYGFAYRILDAQYAGVPQRRRRVFVVGCAGSWQRAAAVLFERHSLQGHPAPRREAGQGIAGSLAASTGGSDENDAKDGRLVAFGGNNTSGLAIRGRGDSHNLEYRQDGTANALLTPNGDRAGIGVGAIAFDCKATQAAEGELSPTLRAMNGVKANAGGQVAVAFGARQSDVTQYGEKTGPLDTDGYTMGIRQGMQVRRLTPRECERLQGFPMSREVIRIDACLDRPNCSVIAALSCRRWLDGALPAGAQELPPLASTAERRSPISQADREPLVALRVHTQSVDELLEIRSRGRSVWSVSNARESRSSLHPTQRASIALGLAQVGRKLAQAIRDGKAASPLNIRLSSAASSGATSALSSGVESAASANAAASDASQARFTTYALGATRPSCDSPAAILLCSVLDAISGCIPSETLPDSFSLELEVGTPYTLIPHRGKPAADGPRYKALGNSWAVPCVRWIGERIEAVRALDQDAP